MSQAEGGSFAAVVERAARHPFAVLFLLCFLAWLPGFFTLPPLDRDESRFAQASKQMLETGDYVDIRFSTGPRYKKPAGIHWLQSVSTAVFGDEKRNQIWTYRLPSLIGAFVAVGLAFWCVRAFAAPPTALTAAAILGLTVLLSAEAKISKTDAVLLATILGTQGLLVRAYLADRLKDRPPPTLGLALAGWTAFAIGILIKGPIIVLVIAVSVVAISLWDREWRWLKTIHPWRGLALAAVIVLPWGIAIAVESGGLFYQKSLGEDFAQKIISGQETHGAPPGYYLALVSFTFWPATLFLLPAIGAAVARRGDPVHRYLLAWAAAAWAMFEITPTKLPHYILPAYPALAFLGALWFTRADAGEPNWERWLRIVSALLFFLAVIAFAGVTAFAPHYLGGETPWWLYAGAGVGLALGTAALVAALRRRRLEAAVWAIATAAIFYPLLTEGTAPRIPDLWLSPRAAEVVWRHATPDDPPAILSGYTEPSLVFLLGTDTHLAAPARAAEIAADQGGLALIGDGNREQFLLRLGELGATAQPVDRVEGLNYSRGKYLHLTLFRVHPAHRVTEGPPD